MRKSTKGLIIKKTAALLLTAVLVFSDLLPYIGGFTKNPDIYAENAQLTENSGYEENDKSEAVNENVTGDLQEDLNKNGNSEEGTKDFESSISEEDEFTYGDGEDETMAPNNSVNSIGINADISSEILDIPKLRSGEKVKEKVNINGKNYYAFSITKADDILALQQVSANDSLEDCAFTFTDSGQGSQWDLSAIAGFTGISPNKEFPFKGIIGANIARGVNYTLSCPLFVYISTDATVQNISLLGKSNNNTSVAAIAENLVKGSERNIAIKNVTIRGSFASNVNNRAVGALFAKVINEGNEEMVLDTDEWTNFSFELNGSSKVSVSSAKDSAGGLAGIISGKVTLKIGEQIDFNNIVVNGNVGYNTKTGTVAGSVLNGAEIIIDSSKEFNILTQMNGKYAGGIIGYVENSEVMINDDAEIKLVTSKGNNPIGGKGAAAAGGIIGYAKNSKLKIKNVSADVLYVAASVSDSVRGYAGAVVGKMEDCYDCEIADITLSSAGSGSISIFGYVIGGVAGEIGGKNIVIRNIKLTGNLYYGDRDTNTYGADGGVVGRVSGQNICIENCSLELRNPGSAKEFINLRGYVRGGIIGDIVSVEDRYNSVKIKDIKVSGINDNICGLPAADGVTQGMVIGNIDKKSLVCIDGTIDLTKVTNVGFSDSYSNDLKYGILVGSQNGALIYREADSVILKRNYTDIKGAKNDVGTYGGIYVNTYIDSQNREKLIEFETSEEEIKNAVKGQVSKNQTGAYILKNKYDFYRVSITQFSDGNFAGNCFGISEASELLAADYEVTADEIDLRNTGIYSLTRTGSTTEEATEENSFKGSFTGVPEKSVIILDNIVTTQYNLGLFSSVSNAVFRNLKITSDDDGGYVYPRNFGALAAICFNSLTVENVTVDTKVRAYEFDTGYLKNDYYYGGAIGYIRLYGNKLKVTDYETYALVENINKFCSAGGFAGYILHNDSAKTDAETDIIFKNIKIGFVCNVASTYYSTDWRAKVIARIGGLAGVVNYHEIEAVDETYTTIALQNVTVDSATIDMSAAELNNERAYSSGGFIGGIWNNVETTISADAVDDTNVTGNSLNIKSGNLYGRGSIGGVYGVYTGKITLKDFKAGEDNITIKSLTNRNYGGFLIYDGRYAYMVIDGYDIIGENITVSGYYSIDDICGYVFEAADSNQGGIINIKDDDFAAGQSQGYINKISQKYYSSYSRYYYNVLELSDEYSKGMLSDTIDSPEKLMVYHIYSYSNSEIRRFSREYMESGAVRNNYTISGAINLTGYSYYPTYLAGDMVINGNNAVIEFPSDSCISMFTVNKIGNSGNRHYRLYGGLFCNNEETAGNVRISSITLRGSVGKAVANSFLYSGTVYGNVNIENITLDGASIYNYNSEHDMGLLISVVGNGTTLNINGVRTTGYLETQRNKKVAAALIGVVGSDTADDIRVIFRNIDVEFMTDDKSANGIDNGISPFKYATLLCKYDYIKDSGSNKGYGVYYFTSEDYANNTVTLGRELATGAELEDDLDVLTNALAYAEFNNDIASIAAAPESYLPYVCVKNTVTVFVNPKSGNITKGCGTYEDPYIIENTKQLYSLYMYLSGNLAYNGILNNWYVNKLGNGNTGEAFCNKGTHEAFRYGDNDENFPAREDMAGAYYIISQDIDMSDITDINTEKLSYDYSGLGSSSYPFTGVIVGRKADGTRPTVVLPGSMYTGNTHRAKNNFGFIQYMRGAVVKDIVFETEKYANADGNELYVSGSSGFVTAVVEGGDNIIDNVTVRGTMYIDSNQTYVGGYAGTIKKGGIILRDVDKANIEGINIDTNGIGDINNNYYGYIVSKVYDGYILYETVDKPAVSETKKTVTVTDLGFDKDEGKYSLSYSFAPVNANYLKQDTSKIQLSVDKAEKQIKVGFDTDKDLEIIAMALNSDSLSFIGRNKQGENGYNSESVNRKAYYNALGTDDMNNSDLIYARTYDNNHYEYPYLLFNYFEPDTSFDDCYGTYISDDGKSYKVSRLNKTAAVEKITGADEYTTIYEAVGGNTIDMTEYGYSFRGLGALYNMVYSKFNGCFNGNNSRIIVDLSIDYDLTLNKLGLFNELDTREYVTALTKKNETDLTAPYIKNIEVSGKVTNNSKINVVNDKNLPDNADCYVNNTRAGGVAAGVSGSYNFSGIVLNDLTVTAYGDAGGIAGRIVNHGNSEYYGISMENCSAINNTTVKSLGIEKDVNCNYDAGGFIGKVGTMYRLSDSGRNQSGYIYMGTVNITDPKADGLLVYSVQGSCGGLIGGAQYLYDTVINISGTGSESAVLNGLKLNIKNNGKIYNESAGGVIGNYTPVRYEQSNETGNVLNISGIEVKNSEILAADMTGSSNASWMCGTYGLGGIIGIANSRNNGDLQTTVNVNNCKLTQLNITDTSEDTECGTTGGVAGSLGAVHGSNNKDYSIMNNLSVTRIEVDGLKISVQKNWTNGGIAGQLSGYENRKYEMIFSDIYVRNAEINCKNKYAGNVGGIVGTISYKTRKVVFKNISVENSKFNTPGSDTTNDNYSTNKSIAGGIIGSVKLGNSNTYCDINGYNITSKGNAISGCYTGGVIGKVSDNITRFTLNKVSISKNMLSGIISGGLFGRNVNCGTDINNLINDVTVKENIITAYGNDEYQGIAGGLIGKTNLNSLLSGKMNFSNIAIEDNVIVTAAHEKCKAGGVFGSVEAGVNNFYSVKLSNNRIGYLEEINTYDKAVFDVLSALDFTQCVKLRNTVKNTFEIPSAGVGNQAELHRYTYGIGNFVGEVADNGAAVKFLGVRLEYDDTYTGTRPLTDVGTISVFSSIDSISRPNMNEPYAITRFTNPFDYRNSVRVIYTNDLNGKDMSDTDYLYGPSSLDEFNAGTMLFSTLGNRIEKYGSLLEKEKAGTLTANDILETYRLNIAYDNAVNANYSTVKQIMDISYLPFEDAAPGFVGADIPIIVADGQYTSAYDVVNAAIDTLTNGGGTVKINSTEDAYSISAKKAIVTKNAAGKYQLSYQGTAPSINVNSISSITYNGFDTYGIDDNGNEYATITVLKVVYGYNASENDYIYEVFPDTTDESTKTTVNTKKVFYIPIFVKERLEVDISFKLKEGAVLNAGDIESTGYAGSVIMAKDTTYSILSNIRYGSSVENPNYSGLTVNKALKLTDVNGDMEFDVGTKLTLIDINTGHSYYYEITAENKELSAEGIPYTDFADENGAAYVNRTMQWFNDNYLVKYDENGEAYATDDAIIVVQLPREIEAENAVYDISISTKGTLYTSQMQINNEQTVEVTSIPGLVINFDNKMDAIADENDTDRTYISGELTNTKKNSVVIDARTAIVAAKDTQSGIAAYWDYVNGNSNVIDSSNNGKYIEIAIYLQEQNASKRMALPVGTAVMIYDDENPAGKRIELAFGQSVIYYYKNSDRNYGLNDITEDTYKQHKIVLDFSNTDLRDYTSSNYEIYMELIRTGNPKYPMSSDRQDDYSKTVATATTKELAVAAQVEELINLGINIYKQSSGKYEIPFIGKIDFSNVIDFENGTDSNIENMAHIYGEKNYYISYKIYKKNTTGGASVYEPIDNEFIKLYYKDGDNYIEYSSNGQTGEGFKYESAYRFTADEIKNGTEGIKGLITRDMKVVVDTEKIKNMYEYLTNYRIEMSLVPYDDGVTEIFDDLTALKDYFVFTIAKLKTDM